MDGQLSFFDPPPILPKLSGEHDDALRALAFLYTATEKGNNSGIRFMMSLDDAMAFCEHPKSSGVLHGTHWAYYFTSVYNFLHAHDDYAGIEHAGARVHEKFLNLKGATEDKGTFDWLIEEMHLHKINISEIPKVLEPLGVRCLV